MGTYKKAITSDCSGCHLMKVNDNHQMTCSWKKSVKILEPQKGKKPLSCKLKREGE